MPQHFGFAALAVVGALAGCTRDAPRGGGTAAPPPPPQPTAMAPVQPEPQAMTAPAAGDELSGTVVETMDSGGYTYAKLDRGTGPVWVAGPETKLTVGTVIGGVKGTLMTGFQSTTLNRTFDQIYFINSFPITGGSPANPHGAPPPAASMIEKVARAEGGQTIAEVFTGKDALAGKPAVVRGKVVKLNNGILGKNWLHLQDGSGGPGTNDLMVTTSATVNVGDIVTARGTIATNKDLGAGYKYEVLLEDAAITK